MALLRGFPIPLHGFGKILLRAFAFFKSRAGGVLIFLIAATSIIENAPLLTRDARILRSKLVPLA